MSPGEVVLLVAALAWAGLVKGVTGMGLPLFATPILAALFGARPAVIIMSIPTFVANVLLIVEGRGSLSIMRRVWPMAVSGVAGILVGLSLLLRLDQNVLALVIASLVLLVLARGDRLLGGDPRATRVRVMGPVLGAASGVLMGTTSIASPIVAGYLHALRLEPREFVVALALIFQVLGTAQVHGLASLGAFDATIVTTALLALAPMLLAFAVGVRQRRRLDSPAFRRIVTAMLALSALVLTWQGLRGLGVL